MRRTKRDRSIRDEPSDKDYAVERAVARVLALAGFAISIGMTLALLFIYPEDDEDGETT